MRSDEHSAVRLLGSLSVATQRPGSRERGQFVLAMLMLLFGQFAVLPRAIFAQAKTGQLPTFGPPEGVAALPGFGRFEDPLPVLTEQDRVYAKNIISSLDKDGDGLLSRSETKPGTKGVNPLWFNFDVDGDQHLKLNEIAYSYAKQRIDKETKARSQALAKKRAANIPVSKQDKSNGSAWVAKLDRNKDRKLSRSEVAAQWGGNSTKMMRDYDLNRSGYLGTSELAYFFAVERMKQAQAQQLMNSRFRGGFQVYNNRRAPQKASATASAEMMRRYDTNRNGALDRVEFAALGGRIADADTDGNGTLTTTELTAWLDVLSARTQSTSSSGSDWFSQQDTNRDGLVTMAEYVSEWTQHHYDRFRGYDSNGDGVITREESRAQKVRGGRRFGTTQVAVIEAGVGVAVNITVGEDFEIADLDVELSIFHAVALELEAILISPSGKQVVLFNGSGKSWKGSHFRGTYIDDEATTLISKSQPPFTGVFQPESNESPQNGGLSNYYGKRSKGVWRLVIRGDRASQNGLLNGCTLVFTPKTAAAKTEPAVSARRN